MKKIYSTPYIEITEIKSDNIMVVSGFSSKFYFNNKRNEITQF